MECELKRKSGRSVCVCLKESDNVRVRERGRESARERERERERARGEGVFIHIFHRPFSFKNSCLHGNIYFQPTSAPAAKHQLLNRPNDKSSIRKLISQTFEQNDVCQTLPIDTIQRFFFTSMILKITP